MAVTLDYTNLVEINNADAITNWEFRGATTTVLDGDTFIEGAGSISGKTAIVGVDGWVYNTGAANITVTNKHLMVWINSFAIISTEALGGIRIRVEGAAGSATVDYGEWYVSGSDTYIGGWQRFVVDCNRGFDASSATPPSKTAIQKIGATMNQTVALMALAQSFYVDAITLSSGPLLVKGGTSGVPGTFEDIITADNANAQTGVVRKINGVYLLHAPITFGDDTSTTSTYFSDKNATLVWRNAKVDANFYDIKVVGNSTGTNEFQLGDVSGSGATAIGTSAVSIDAAPVISRGSYTYNENGGSADTITRSAGSFIIDGLLAGMIITVTDTASNNGSYTIDTIAATTITLITANDLAAEGPVTSTLSGKRLHTLTASNANVNSIKIYNTTITNAGAITLGSTSTAIGGSGKTVHLIDNTIAKPTSIVRNIDTASTVNILRNKATFATTSVASLDVVDARDTPLTEWQIVGDTLAGPGFQKSTAGTATINISEHNFNQMKKPYITIGAEAETWNVINPTWTITDQTELDFIGTAQGEVDEKFELTGTVQQPSGTAVVGAETYLFEASPTPTLPAANQVESIAGGVANSEVLRRLYTAATPSSALTVVTHDTFAWKVYEYGYLPFVTALTINSAVTSTAIMLSDTFQVETVAGTARTLGDTTNTVAIEQQTNSATLLKYTGGTGTLSVGQVVGNNSNAAEGTVVEILEGNSTAGTILMDTRNATAWPTGAHTLDNSGVGWTATFTSGSIRNFKWLIDAASLTMQQLYDYLNAKLSEDTLDTATPSFMDTIIIWGRAEHGTPVQGSGSKFKTVRNVAQTQGWAIYNTNLIGVDFYTADDATSFTPQTLVTVTVTIQNQAGAIVPGAEVAIFQDNATRTVVLASTTTNASGQVSTSVVASLGAIIIRARQSTDTMSFLTSESTTDGVNSTLEELSNPTPHNFQTGDAVVYDKDGGSVSISASITDGNTYYVRAVDTTSVKLYASAANAISDTSAFNLTASGTETHKLDPVRFVAGSATGTVGATNFSAQITMITDGIATG